MSEFSDDYPQYELMIHHSEEDGKVKRRKLWNVFWVMFGITIIEILIGAYAGNIGLLVPGRNSGVLLKFIIIALTLGNVIFTLFSFMQLGQQRKTLKYIIIIPYVMLLSYLIFIVFTESIYSRDSKSKSDDLLLKQKKCEMNAAAFNQGNNEKQERDAH